MCEQFRRNTKGILPAVVLMFGAMVAVSCGEGRAERQAAAARAQAKAQAAEEQARADALAALERERLAALWRYHDEPVDGGTQVTAALDAAEGVDADGAGPKRVQLVFRDHPEWGRSSYLVLEAGDFDCYGSCTVDVIVDDEPAVEMKAHRPKTDEAIAMFIDDWQALWRLTADADRIGVEFPVKAGGTRTARFDVGGLDSSKMPAWDEMARQAEKP